MGCKMQKLKILNKKEIKRIISLLKEQWGFDGELDYAFLQNDKGKVFIVNKDVSKIDFEKVRINSIGMYFGMVHDDGVRLSIEGSQLIGHFVKKNILELDEKGMKEWLAGEDLIMNIDKGYYIIKNGDDFLGTGKATGEKVLNFVSKTRRVRVI